MEEIEARSSTTPRPRPTTRRSPPRPSREDETAALRAEVADLKDRLLRALADVENIRKRAERDRRDAELYGATRFARDLLSVHDNFDRALDTVTDAVRAAAPGLIEGIELTRRELLNAFEKHRIVKIDPEARRPLRPQAAPGDVRGAGARHQGRRHHPGDGRRLHDRRPPAAPRPGRRLRRRPGRAAAAGRLTRSRPRRLPVIRGRAAAAIVAGLLLAGRQPRRTGRRLRPLPAALPDLPRHERGRPPPRPVARRHRRPRGRRGAGFAYSAPWRDRRSSGTTHPSTPFSPTRTVSCPATHALPGHVLGRRPGGGDRLSRGRGRLRVRPNHAARRHVDA